MRRPRNTAGCTETLGHEGLRRSEIVFRIHDGTRARTGEREEGETPPIVRGAEGAITADRIYSVIKNRYPREGPSKRRGKKRKKSMPTKLSRAGGRKGKRLSYAKSRIPKKLSGRSALNRGEDGVDEVSEKTFSNRGRDKD